MIMVIIMMLIFYGPFNSGSVMLKGSLMKLNYFNVPKFLDR